MRRRRRILLSAGVVAACIAAAIGVVAMLPPRPGVTKANFDRVQEGMTRAEIDAIFGAPSRRSVAFLGSGSVMSLERWNNVDGARADFILIDGVADDNKTWTPSTESIPDKLRRWLGLAK